MLPKLDSFEISKTPEIAKELEEMNKSINIKNPYLLVGPGRWGSSDPWLGIPVTWEQISGAKSIIELTIPELNAEPSFGSHFFHNLTNLRIGYLTQKKNNKTFDNKWLGTCRIKKETKYLKWISLKNPLMIQIDGSTGKAIILKQFIQKENILDENESTGI